MGNKQILKFEDVMHKIEEVVDSISNKIEKKEEVDINKNIFCILGVQDFEIRHSNFLAWLLRTNKQFLFEFLTNKNILNINKEKAKNICNSHNIVYREYKQDTFGRSIDIVIECKDEKVVIVIENKIYAEEGKNQLSDYYLFVEQNKEYINYEKKYIYLTLNGNEPISKEDRKNYISVSYNQILDILTKIHKKGENKQKQYKDILIEDYIDILKDKTVKVMDRVSEYYKLFNKYKEIMVEMNNYIPNIEKRAQIEKEIIKNYCNIELKSEKANTFVSFLNNDIQNMCVKNNLPKTFFEFGISNDPYNAMSFYFKVERDKNQKYIDFCKKFREKFNRTDKSKNGDFVTLYEERMIVSNKTSGFLKETEFQEQIKIVIENLFNDSKSIYNQIVDFIKGYFI